MKKYSRHLSIFVVVALALILGAGKTKLKRSGTDDVYIPTLESNAKDLNLDGKLVVNGDLGITGFIGSGRSPTTELDILGIGSNYVDLDTSGTTTVDRAIRFKWGGTTSVAGTQKFEIRHSGTTDTLSLTPAGGGGVTIDSSGNVGIGGAPTAPTDWIGNNYTEIIGASIGGLILNGARDTNTLFTSSLIFSNANNANSTYNHAQSKNIAIIGARTVTSDSNADDDSGGSLSFWTKPDGGVLNERMTIDSSGNVGIGRTPTHQLDLYGSGTNLERLNIGRGSDSSDQNLILGYSSIVSTRTSTVLASPQTPLSFIQRGSDGDRVNMVIDNYGKVGIGTSPSSGMGLHINSGGLRVQSINVNAGDGGALRISGPYDAGVIYQYSSSKKYKDNIRPLEVDSSLIYDFDAKTYEPKGTDKTTFGYIAESIMTLVPNLVPLREDGEAYGVSYDRIVVLIIEEMKILRKENKEQQAIIEDQKAKNELMQAWICEQSNAPISLCN